MTSGQMIAGSAIELQKKLDEHCLLVKAVFAVTPEVEPPCARIWRLRFAIANAIETLESTRKAFKSNELGELRKRLIRVLTEYE